MKSAPLCSGFEYNFYEYNKVKQYLPQQFTIPEMPNFPRMSTL